MLLQKMREDVVRFAKKMIDYNLTVGTSGNVSCIDRLTGHVAITPSGMAYEDLTAEDIPIIDLEGNIVDGKRKPSTERLLHIEAYRRRLDVGAVIHTHSSYATAMATLNQSIPVLLAEVAAMAGGPVPVAPYTVFGTQEFAEVAMQHMGDKPAVLLQNHGVVSVGTNLQKAFVAAMDVEEAAKIYLLCRMAGHEPTLIPEGDIQKLHRLYQENYGQ